MFERGGPFTLLQIAAYPGKEREFAKAVEPHTGKLPKTSGVARDGVLKTGLRQYWLFGRVVPVPGETGASVDLTASRVRFTLAGRHAWRRLQETVPVDLDPAVFKQDHFALTGIHHTPALLWRTGEERYDVFALRTYAADIEAWLGGQAGNSAAAS